MASRWATPTPGELAREQPAGTPLTTQSTPPPAPSTALPTKVPPTKATANLIGLGTPAGPTLAGRTVSQPRPADAPAPHKDNDGWYSASPVSSPAVQQPPEAQPTSPVSLSPAAAAFTPAPPTQGPAAAGPSTDHPATRTASQAKSKNSTQSSRWAAEPPPQSVPIPSVTANTPASSPAPSDTTTPPSGPKGARGGRTPNQARKPSGSRTAAPNLAANTKHQKPPANGTAATHSPVGTPPPQQPSLLSRLGPAPTPASDSTESAIPASRSSANSPPTGTPKSNPGSSKPARQPTGPPAGAKVGSPKPAGAGGARPAKTATRTGGGNQTPEKVTGLEVVGLSELGFVCLHVLPVSTELQTHKLSAAELDEVMAARRVANEEAKAKAARRQRDLEAYTAQASVEDTERSRLAEAKRAHVEEQRRADAERRAHDAEASRVKKERDAHVSQDPGSAPWPKWRSLIRLDPVRPLPGAR